jgi:hypothetical protein
MYQVSCPANGLCHPRGLTTFYLVDGAADEWAADLKEAQPPVDLMGNADTHSRANVRSLSNRSPKPKRTAGTQVNSIQPLIYLQCSRSRPGPLAKSLSLSVLRSRFIRLIPSRGSMARSSTPAPIPGSSAVTLSM